MSYNVFPQLSGITWNIKKRPTWNTTKMLTAAGNEFRTGYRQNPLTEFDLSYSYLSPTDKLSMEGFFNGQNGALTPFYFDLGVATNTASDNSVTAFTFGIGDGVTTTFTLIKPAGTGAVEPIGGVNGAPTVYVNGTVTSVTVNGNLVTFATAPASGAVLTWTGNFYYLVRFMEDVIEFNQLMNQMYELQECKLVSVQ